LQNKKKTKNFNQQMPPPQFKQFPPQFNMDMNQEIDDPFPVNRQLQPHMYQPYNAKRVYENFEERPKLKKQHNHNHNDSSDNHHNCVDIAEHTSNCLVCSKLYSSNNTLYILLIIFLAIVNLLLLKRILEVPTSG
jgi:hypothetical protein